MPSNHLILCRPLLLLPSIPPSIRVFSNESTLRMRWPKYWSFTFSISPSNEHSGLISIRMDWLDLLAVQGTLKSLLQHQSSKALILLCSAFFIIQLLHPYLTTGKTIALTRQTFVDKGPLLESILGWSEKSVLALIVCFLPPSLLLSSFSSLFPLYFSFSSPLSSQANWWFIPPSQNHHTQLIRSCIVQGSWPRRKFELEIPSMLFAK